MSSFQKGFFVPFSVFSPKRNPKNFHARAEIASMSRGFEEEFPSRLSVGKHFHSLTPSEKNLNCWKQEKLLSVKLTSSFIIHKQIAIYCEIQASWEGKNHEILERILKNSSIQAFSRFLAPLRIIHFSHSYLIANLYPTNHITLL